MAPRRSPRGHASSEANDQAPTTTKPAHTADKPAPAPPGPSSDGEPDPAPKEHATTGPKHYTHPYTPRPLPCALYPPTPSQGVSLVFTHGAGGGMSTPACTSFATGFSSVAPIVLFEARGKLDRRAAAMAEVFRFVRPLAIGGRSMGARAACEAAAETRAGALVLVSYPLVSGQGESRAELLLGLRDVDVLLIIPSRDRMCPVDQLQELRPQMQVRTWLVVVDGADHGMNLAHGGEQVRRATGRVAAAWIGERDDAKTEMRLGWDGERVVEESWR